MTELCEYQIRLYNNCGKKEINEELLILKETMEQESIKYLLDHLHGLPYSYLKIISEYDLYEKFIYYFFLSPEALFSTVETFDMVETLVNCNTVEPFLPKDFLDKKGLFWIGSDACDHMIYVAKGSYEFEEGEVVLIEQILEDEDNPAPEDIQPLAKDFEQFLIVAGNFDQIVRREIKTDVKKDSSDFEIIRQKLLERLKKLGVAEKYHDVWLSFFC